MEKYSDLVVWQKSIQLVKEIYRLTGIIGQKDYSLADQMKRAAVSIPSNIAEGYGRNTSKDYVRFLSITRGSKYELETQLILCNELGYLSEEQTKTAFAFLDEIGKMLNAIINKLS